MQPSISTELLSASTIAIRDCMGAKAGESVLIVTDEPLRHIGYALRQAAKDLGHDVMLVEILPRATNGAEPPPQIAQLMTQADVVLCPTSKSLTHTDARRAASAAGARVGTLPGVTEDIMVRCMNADYQRIAERTHRLCAMMAGTQDDSRSGARRHRHPVAGRRTASRARAADCFESAGSTATCRPARHSWRRSRASRTAWSSSTDRWRASASPVSRSASS